MPKEKLRNFGKFLGGYFVIALLLTVTVMVGCKNAPWSNPNNYDTANDSVLVAQQVEAIVNPQFTTVQEIVDFRQQTNEGFTIDSIFRAIPEQVLHNVASVLIKKNGTVDKKSIVEEYRANSAVYDNLPATTQQPANTTQEVDLNATDLGNRRSESDVISTSYQYRTDTINGKPVKIQIKKEESYVR